MNVVVGIRRFSYILRIQSLSNISNIPYRHTRIASKSTFYLVDKPVVKKRKRVYPSPDSTRHRLVQYSLPVKAYNYIANLVTNISGKMDKVDQLIPSVVIPHDVRGMKNLDRGAFVTQLQVPSLLIPVTSVTQIMKKLKDVALFKRPGIKPLVDLPEEDSKVKTHKRLLIHPDVYRTQKDVPTDIVAFLNSQNVDFATWTNVDVNLDYSNWTHTEILKAILPEDNEGVSGFSQIGHIVHLNLREDLLEYKSIIGDVLLDKVMKAKTIVNKMDTIDNEYRFFKLELLAGEENYITQMKENGFTFEMDFSKVYWNTRLGQEHHRIVSLLKSGDVVFDVFGGVGPFAVPAAKKKCKVYANDLNPESFKWMVSNAKLNKVQGNLSAYNQDGRDFIKDVIKPNMIDLLKANKKTDVHIIMNLPAMAMEFLDTYKGLLTANPCSDSVQNVKCTVYCYCFKKSDISNEELHKRAEDILGCPIPDHELRFVRSVAPSKDMYCIIFPLTESILLADSAEEPLAKKIKT